MTDHSLSIDIANMVCNSVLFRQHVVILLYQLEINIIILLPFVLRTTLYLLSSLLQGNQLCLYVKKFGKVRMNFFYVTHPRQYFPSNDPFTFSL